MSCDDFISKLRGTNGDHVADQKKDNKLLQEWKDDERNQRLSRQKMAELPFLELISLLMVTKEVRIDELGGSEVWETLSPEQRLHHDQDIMDALS